jgi:transposase
MSPEYVRPYIKAQKNDDRDAEGIAEAASRPTMRFVELKSQGQLDIQTLHRVRSRLVAERTNLINQLRAILLERGVIFPAGRRKLELGIDCMLADEDTTLSQRLRQLAGELRAEWRELDAKIERLNGEFVAMARDDPAARRLTSIPGVGVLNATALIAAVGDAGSFAKARDLGIPAEVLDAAQTAKLDPGVRMNVAGSVYYPKDCHLAPARFMAAAAGCAMIVRMRRQK